MHLLRSVQFREPESALHGCGLHKPHPPSMMEDVSINVEASTDLKRPRLEPQHSRGEGSAIQAAINTELAVSESESRSLQLREVTTLPYSSDEDGESSSSGDDDDDDEEEEEGSDMRIQVWSCRMFSSICDYTL